MKRRKSDTKTRETGAGVTERLARAAAVHPIRTIAVFVLLVAAAVLGAGTLLGSGITSEAKFRASEPASITGQRLVEDRLTGPRQMTDFVIVESATMTVDDPAYKAYVTALATDIAALGPNVVEGAATYYQTKDPTLVSKDEHSTLIPVIMAGGQDKALENAAPLHELVVHSGAAGFTLAQTGDASLNAMANELAKSDLERAEIFGMPVALIVLLLVFGAVLAAFMPLLLSIISILLAVALTGLIGQVYPMNTFVLNILTMMGLAVGIDYTLFIISRYREERARGLEKIDAIAATGATANRAIFFSGMTVVLAMLGMVVVPMDITISMGLGVMLVVFTTLLTSLILLPAILGLLGDKVNALRVPIVGRFATRRAAGHEGVWERLSHSIMRRPVVWLAAAVTVLLLAASPVLMMNTGNNGASAANFPDDRYAKQGWDVLDRDFSLGKTSPVQIVVDGPAGSTAVKAGVQGLRTALEEDGRFGPVQVVVNKAGDLTVLSTPLPGDPAGDATQAVIRDLRATVVPAAFGGLAGHVYVTGNTAGVVDYLDFFDTWMPIAMAVVLSLSFVLLLLAFRSDRHPRQGDPDEPALRGRGLRPAGAGVPEGRRRRAARHAPGGHDRGVGAAHALLPPLRPLHGLPGLPAQPHQGALRQDRRHPRGRGPRRRPHRRDHHRRGRDHGLRVRRHGERRTGHVPADGLRTGGRDLHRRHDRADDHRARRHGAPRRLELVPAAVARVAAERERRGSRPGGPTRRRRRRDSGNGSPGGSGGDAAAAARHRRRRSGPPESLRSAGLADEAGRGRRGRGPAQVGAGRPQAPRAGGRAAGRRPALRSSQVTSRDPAPSSSSRPRAGTSRRVSISSNTEMTGAKSASGSIKACRLRPSVKERTTSPTRRR